MPQPHFHPDSLPDPSRRWALPFDANGQLREEVFGEIQRLYRTRTGYNILYADQEGNLLFGMPDCQRFPCRLSCRECRREALERAIQRGHPAVCLCADQFAIWGVPVMLNQDTRGALIVVGVPAPQEAEVSTANFEEACQQLLELAVEHNLTNRNYLESQRSRGALRQFQTLPPETRALSSTLTFRNLRPALEREEARLGQGILQEDDALAHEAIEGIVNLLRSLSDLPRAILHGYGTHLLTLMHQSAETASGRYTIVLEHCYTCTARLLSQETPEDVFTEWIRSLGTLLDLVRRNHSEESSSQLGRALSHMEVHFSEQLTRNDVARIAGVSESHLSRLLREKTGRSFTEILNRHRVDRAAQLLLRTQKNLLTIALEVGFSDQSYFGRVFRRYYGQTPDQFRHGRETS